MCKAFWIIFFLIITTFFSNNDLFADKKSKALTSSFLITNDGDDDKEILLNGLGGFFGNLDEIISFINNNYDSYFYPYSYQKAWRFMVDYTWYARLPLTNKEWYHNAVQFINSTGWGFCDDKAIVLAKIWMAMGYKSRVYYLNGHVVPEVYFRKHWEMWDPTFHVFYKDKAGNILGVEDLFKDNTPILNINDDIRITQSIWAQKMGFSKKTAQIYAPSDKNNIYIPVADSVRHNFAKFLLPKGSFIVFPIYKKYPLKSTSADKTKNLTDYAQLMLYVPPQWTGEIKYPLVFHALSASGAEISIDNRKYKLNDKNQDVVVEEFCSQSTIEIKHNEKGINLFFLINPRLFSRLNNFDKIKHNLIYSNIHLLPIEISFKGKHDIIYLNEIEKDKWQTYLKIFEYFLKNMFI